MEFRLCYVEGCWAYFTTRSVTDQSGDDWNDTPYECNAGEPYEDEGTVYADNGTWEIMKVAFYGDFVPPCYDYLNSPWSVEQINKGVTPWLVAGRFSTETKKLFAGATFDEFVEFIQSNDGQVYINLGIDFGVKGGDWSCTTCNLKKQE